MFGFFFVNIWYLREKFDVLLRVLMELLVVVITKSTDL